MKRALLTAALAATCLLSGLAQAAQTLRLKTSYPISGGAPAISLSTIRPAANLSLHPGALPRPQLQPALSLPAPLAAPVTVQAPYASQPENLLAQTQAALQAAAKSGSTAQPGAVWKSLLNEVPAADDAAAPEARPTAASRISDRSIPGLNMHGYPESVHIVATPEYFKSLTTWKKAFSIYRIEGLDKLVIFLASWKDGERESAHSIIDRAVEAEFNAPGLKLIFAEKGYIQPAEGGRYMIYDLPGSAIYSYVGENGNALSPAAQLTKHVFARNLGIYVRFPDPEDLESQQSRRFR
jgi:hypothetical protein